MDNITLDYRVKAYWPCNATPTAATMLVSGHMTEQTAHILLDQLSDAGIISGGHIERNIQGFGWCIADQEPGDHPESPE